jgi:hypothetical protein
MEMLNIKNRKPEFIKEVNMTPKETVGMFIEMIDFLRNHYSDMEYQGLIGQMLFITQEEIDNLHFNEEQFNKLMGFYLKDHGKFSIEEDIVGHYTGYEGQSFPS